MHDPDMAKYNDSLTYHIFFHSHIVYCVCLQLLDKNWLRELTPHCTIKFSLRVKTSKLKTNFFQKSTKIIQDNSYKYKIDRNSFRYKKNKHARDQTNH